jgi:hypothetical protein
VSIYRLPQLINPFAFLLLGIDRFSQLIGRSLLPIDRLSVVQNNYPPTRNETTTRIKENFRIFFPFFPHARYTLHFLAKQPSGHTKDMNEMLASREYLSELATEILVKVFAYLTFDDLSRVVAVSPDWFKALTTRPLLWSAFTPNKVTYSAEQAATALQRSAGALEVLELVKGPLRLEGNNEKNIAARLKTFNEARVLWKSVRSATSHGQLRRVLFDGVSSLFTILPLDIDDFDFTPKDIAAFLGGSNLSELTFNGISGEEAGEVLCEIILCSPELRTLCIEKCDLLGHLPTKDVLLAKISQKKELPSNMPLSKLRKLVVLQTKFGKSCRGFYRELASYAPPLEVLRLDTQDVVATDIRLFPKSLQEVSLGWHTLHANFIQQILRNPLKKLEICFFERCYMSTSQLELDRRNLESICIRAGDTLASSREINYFSSNMTEALDRLLGMNASPGETDTSQVRAPLRSIHFGSINDVSFHSRAITFHRSTLRTLKVHNQSLWGYHELVNALTTCDFLEELELVGYGSWINFIPLFFDSQHAYYALPHLVHDPTTLSSDQFRTKPSCPSLRIVQMGAACIKECPDYCKDAPSKRCWHSRHWKEEDEDMFFVIHSEIRRRFPQDKVAYDCGSVNGIPIHSQEYPIAPLP